MSELLAFWIVVFLFLISEVIGNVEPSTAKRRYPLYNLGFLVLPLNKLNKISKMLTAIKKNFIFTLKADIITLIPMRYYF